MAETDDGFGARLSLAMKLLNISHGALASAAKADKSLVSRWARGMTTPRGPYLAVLTEIIHARAPRFTQLSWDLPLDEFARVVKPGGEIVITTRVGAEEGVRKTVEKTLMPLTSRMGFRTEFAWRRYTDWAATRSDVRLIERRPLPPLGHFSLVRYEKLAEPARAAA